MLMLESCGRWEIGGRPVSEVQLLSVKVRRLGRQVGEKKPAGKELASVSGLPDRSKAVMPLLAGVNDAAATLVSKLSASSSVPSPTEDANRPPMSVHMELVKSAKDRADHVPVTPIGADHAARLLGTSSRNRAGRDVAKHGAMVAIALPPTLSVVRLPWLQKAFVSADRRLPDRSSVVNRGMDANKPVGQSVNCRLR